MTTDQQADRLACPFCNCIVLGHCGFHMFCIRCGAEGPDSDEEDEQSAIAAWNRRATLARTPSVPDDVAARWQSIETAPKDGTLILVYDGSEPMTVTWEEFFGWQDNARGSYWGFTATHWMPLPEPPTAARASHEGEQP